MSTKRSSISERSGTGSSSRRTETTPPTPASPLPSSAPGTPKRRTSTISPLAGVHKSVRPATSSSSVRSRGSVGKRTPSSPLPPVAGAAGSGSGSKRRSNRNRSGTVSGPAPRRPPRSDLRLSLANASVPSLTTGSVEDLSNPSSESDLSPPMPSTPGTPSTPTTPGLARPASAHVRGGRTRRKPVPSSFDEPTGAPGTAEMYPRSHAHSRSLSTSTLLFTQPEYETLADVEDKRGHTRTSTGSLSSLSGVSVLSLERQRDSVRDAVRASRSDSLVGPGAFVAPYGYPQKQQYVLPVDPPNECVRDSISMRDVRGLGLGLPIAGPPLATYLPNVSSHSISSMSFTHTHTHSHSHSHGHSASLSLTHAPSAVSMPASASTPILGRYYEDNLTPAPVHYGRARARTDPTLTVFPPDLTPRARSASRGSDARPRGQSVSTWFSAPSEVSPTFKHEPAEPHTTARALWTWGFVCPPLWILGMFMCVPAKRERAERGQDEAYL